MNVTYIQVGEKKIGTTHHYGSTIKRLLDDIFLLAKLSDCKIYFGYAINSTTVHIGRDKDDFLIDISHNAHRYIKEIHVFSTTQTIDSKSVIDNKQENWIKVAKMLEKIRELL